MKVLLPAFGRLNRPTSASTFISRLRSRCSPGKPGLESGVTQTVPAALHNHQLLAGLGQVANDFLGRGVDDRGADRYAQHHVFTFFTGAVGAAAVGTTLGI